MSNQPTPADFFKAAQDEWDKLEAKLQTTALEPVVDYTSVGEEYPIENPFPNPILVFKPEYAQQAEFEGFFIEKQRIEINVTLVNYTVTFYVNKKLVKEMYWEVLNDISIEDVNSNPLVNKMVAGLKELIAKLDLPYITNLFESYKAYLKKKLEKRNALPIQERIKRIVVNPDKLHPIEAEATKKGLYDMLKSNIYSKPRDIFLHSATDVILTFMLAARGIGPAEVCFTSRFLRAARYRSLTSLTRVERKQALLYYANSIPKGSNKVAISTWKKALGKLTEKARSKRFYKNVASCIRFFGNKVNNKKGSYKLKFKLLQSRIWQKNFQKNIERILGIVWKVVMRAAAKHKPPMQPPESPMPQVMTYVQNLKRDIDREIQEILHRVRNINDDFKLSQETNNELAKELQKNSEALDILRHEMLALALESKDELAAIRAPVHEQNSALGDLRQLRVELETKIDRLAEEKQKIEKLAKDSIELANKESKARIEECKKQFEGRINNMPDEFKLQAGAMHREYQAIQSECKSLKHEFNSLEPSKFRLEMNTLSNQMSNINKSLPDFEYRMAELERTLTSQTNTMIEARKLRDELRSVTQETLAKLSRENRLLEDKRAVESANLRKQGKSHKRSKLAAAKENIKRSEAKIVEEVETTVPRIFNFIKEWNSFKKGDLFRFSGQLLEVDDTFNPSIRVKECGQSTSKWEAQKFANEIWYYRGKL